MGVFFDSAIEESIVWWMGRAGSSIGEMLLKPPRKFGVKFFKQELSSSHNGNYPPQRGRSDDCNIA